MNFRQWSYKDNNYIIRIDTYPMLNKCISKNRIKIYDQKLENIFIMLNILKHKNKINNFIQETLMV